MGIKKRIRRLVKHEVGPRLVSRLPERSDLPLDFFGLEVGPNDRLHLGEHDLVALTNTFGSPLHVVDGRRLDAAADEALAPLRDEARVGCDVFYSYKTNPVPAVLRRLHDRGVGAEVISAYELWLALELGVPGSRIIYNGPAKSPDSVRSAIEHDVLAINANSIDDAHRIVAVAHEVGRPVHLGLRVALSGAWGGQFGIAPKIGALTELIETLLADDLVDLMCLHVHRGVTMRSEADVAGHVGAVLELLDRLRETTGWSPRMIDLGGSLGSRTVSGFSARDFRLNRFIGADLPEPSPEATVTVGTASEISARAIRDWAASAGIEAPAGVIEPGRSLTSSTQLLLTSVIDTKHDVSPTHAIVDAGINLAEATRNEYHQLYSASTPAAPADHRYRIAGPICTPADVLYNDWRLPELDEGHVLAIMDSGAYFVPFSTSFSFPRPAIVVCDAGAAPVVARRAERFDDLIRLDHTPSPTR